MRARGSLIDGLKERLHVPFGPLDFPLHSRTGREVVDPARQREVRRRLDGVRAEVDALDAAVGGEENLASGVLAGTGKAGREEESEGWGRYAFG